MINNFTTASLVLLCASLAALRNNDKHVAIAGTIASLIIGGIGVLIQI
jgi:hypothetical protein